MNNSGIGILGVGSYVPEKILTNFDLEKIVNTSDEWIRTRSGIKERRIARENERTSDMAVSAAKAAVKDAGILPQDIGLVIVATITGDYQFPATACLVQDKLRINNVPGFDINAACSGFIYGLETARQFINSGAYNNVLVIGAEKLSSVIDWQDRNVCVLLGDGAGAAIVGRTKNGGDILGSYIAVDGSCADLLKLPAGGSAIPATEETVRNRLHFMKMEGREVFKRAVNVMTRSGLEALNRCKLSIGDIDCIIPHQANIRIIEAIAERLKIPMEKVFTNIDRYGNMSAASIPVALDEAVKKGVIKRGNKVLLVAFGAGFTWGSMVLKY